MSLNQGAALPAVSAVRFYDVIAPKRDLPLEAVLLADTFFGRWMHWVEYAPGKGVAVPCTEDEHCPRCQLQLPHRWNGYIAALNVRSRDFFVLGLTEGAARQLLPFLTDYGTLRGLQFIFTRGKDKVNARVDASFVCKCNEGVVPQEFSIHSSLSRLWGLNEECVKNGGRRVNVPLPSGGGSRTPPRPPRESYVPTGEDDEPAPPCNPRPRGGDGASAPSPRKPSVDEVMDHIRKMRGQQ